MSNWDEIILQLNVERKKKENSTKQRNSNRDEWSHADETVSKLIRINQLPGSFEREEVEALRKWAIRRRLQKKGEDAFS